MSDLKDRKHVLAFMWSAWGHNKSLVVFLAKLVRQAPVYVTYFTGISIYELVVGELSKQFLPEGEEALRSSIRVIGLPESPIPFETGSYRAAFANSYKLLCQGHPVPATPDGTKMYESVGPPNLAILDFFLYESMQFIRNISVPKVPIYTWQSGSTSIMLYLFGPEYLGGNGDLAKKIEAIQATDEQDRFDKAQALYRRSNGNLVQIPSLPPMYEHEFNPQKMIISADVARHCQYVHRMFLESDGSIHCTNRIYEGLSLEAWAEWLKEKPLFVVGPIETPLHLAKIHNSSRLSKVEKEVQDFLDGALRKHGENSVVYISFGTLFWSTEPEKIWTVIDVLIEQQIPFLFSHASPFAVISDELKEKVASSGLGYMANWLPQQMILNHEACGWFLSHGGQNSVMESLLAGVPIIFWPFEADQPSNAALVSMKLNAGYELLEARSGLALQPMHRLGGKAPEGTVEALRKEVIDILTKARGEDGHARRGNAQRLGKQFSEVWEEGGLGWKELQRFVDLLN